MLALQGCRIQALELNKDGDLGGQRHTDLAWARDRGSLRECLLELRHQRTVWADLKAGCQHDRKLEELADVNESQDTVLELVDAKILDQLEQACTVRIPLKNVNCLFWTWAPPAAPACLGMIELAGDHLNPRTKAEWADNLTVTVSKFLEYLSTLGGAYVSGMPFWTGVNVLLRIG